MKGRKEGRKKGKKKERTIIEGGYFYEIYIKKYFVRWNRFVGSSFLCHDANWATWSR
jgi:hypothetical protein